MKSRVSQISSSGGKKCVIVCYVVIADFESLRRDTCQLRKRLPSMKENLLYFLVAIFWRCGESTHTNDDLKVLCSMQHTYNIQRNVDTKIQN